MIPNFYNFFQKVEGTVLNSFSEFTIILIPKPNKCFIQKENYKSVYLMNINRKVLNKILADRIQQCKKIYTITKQLLQVCKAASTFKISGWNSSHQKAKEEKLYDFIIRCRKRFNKFQKGRVPIKYIALG